MNKQCGTCKFWDRIAQENAISDCMYTLYPKCFEREDKMPMASEEGNDCPVYISIPLKKKQPRRVVLEETNENVHSFWNNSIHIDDTIINIDSKKQWKIVEDTNARNN